MSTSQRDHPGETREEPARPPSRLVPAPAPARRKVTVRRVSAWSVLKLSLVFYFCLLLVVMVGLMVLWSLVVRLGLVQALTDLAIEYGAAVSINGGNLARVIFLFGLVNVVLWSGINVFLAFLYNLIADLVGGLRLTLAEDVEAR